MEKSPQLAVPDVPSPPRPIPVIPPHSSSRPPPTPAELQSIIHAASLARPKPTPERRDEKCWTWSHQTNARRALGREPATKMLCYLNMRNQIAAMIPIPNQPGAYFVKDQPKPPVPSAALPKTDDTATEVPPYHWQRLDGRYLYFATGRSTIAAHLVEMGGTEWKGIAAIEERCAEKQKLLAAAAEDPKTRDERRMKRAMGLEDADESESLVHLSELYSTSLRRFHTHLVRIYSPAIKNLARLPETFRDGTQSRMVETLWGKLSDGSAFELVGRMVQSTRDVAAELRKRRAEGGGEGGVGGMGGLGGVGGPPTGV